MFMVIHLKRIYEKPTPSDGFRILVDRLWPRGLSQKKARIDLWLKEIAPTAGLRIWFRHDPEKWGEFKGRYFAELDGHAELVNAFVEQLPKRKVTLLFASKEGRFNHAVALKNYMEKRVLK